MNLRIEDMTLEQKIGMVLCARRFEEKEDIDFTLELIKKRALACVQVPFTMPEMVKLIKETADYPILIINDMERGFPTSDLPSIPLVSLSAAGKKEYFRAFAKGVVRDAKKAGYCGTWNPVLDILRANGPCSVSRKASDDPMKVAELAAEIAMVYKENNFLACGKHYPGGEEGGVDSHMREGSSGVTEEGLINFDLVPYKYLMDRGLLTSIMTRHGLYRNIDPERPASLSKKVIDIIKNMGFDGLIFTDSLAMMGVLQKFGEENTYGMAVAAGNDIILTNYRTPTKKCYEMLMQNYLDGLFTEERLNEAVSHILKAQEYISTEPENPTEFTAEDEQMLYDLAKDCITAITDEGLDASIPGKNEEKLFVILTENSGVNEAAQQEITDNTWYFPHKIANKIRETFPGAGIEYLVEFPDGAQNEYILNEATKYKEVVFITFCKTGAYYGTDGLTRRAECVINSLAYSDKISAVVHFGNPFAMRKIEHVPRRIFGYHIPESQIYAIDVLAGKLEAKGKLPFEIEFE